MELGFERDEEEEEEADEKERGCLGLYKGSGKKTGCPSPGRPVRSTGGNRDQAHLRRSTARSTGYG